MRHLMLEEIARLVDEPPRAEEAAHLAACPACRGELEAMREQTEALAGLAAPEPPPWARLEARLEAEGLLRRPRPAYATLRMAASVAVLALGGAAALAAWRGEEEAPPTLPPAVAEAPVPPPSAVRLAAEHPPEPTAPAEEVRPRRAPAAPAAPPEEEAVRELREAEAAYLRGLAEYASLADATSTSDPVARLAALEGLVRVTRSALDRAPGDPVFNGYYLAAVGERDAMIRQLARTSYETWY